MKQKYIWLLLSVPLLSILFCAQDVAIDDGMARMAHGQAVDQSKTIAVTLHEVDALKNISISAEIDPMEASLLKAQGGNLAAGNSMPLSPMPAENSFQSSDDTKSDLFSFDTPAADKETRSWGWVDRDIQNIDSYRGTETRRESTEDFFQNSDSGSGFGGARESFFDNTLYGSDKDNASAAW
ncbi:MAG: hypothetical protein KAI74_00955 [Kiritimatiellae bacterium]|nr:hypothetical protein [Kiritimatiellia bacterium]